MVKHFVSWLRMIETHPDLAEKLGEGKGAYTKMVRALPTAIETAKQAGIFPKVILLKTEFQASLDFYAAQDAAISLLPEFEF